MPKLFSIDTEDQVKRLSKQNLTNVEIKKKLAEDKIDIHVKTISRMLKNIGIGRQAFSQNKPVPKYKRPPTKINPPLVKKVKNSIRKKNPAAYRHIKSKTLLSLVSINKVIHQNLGKLSRKKSEFISLPWQIKKTVRPIVASFMKTT